jgi:hypothetical protein
VIPELSPELLDFTSHELGVQRDRLTPEASLVHDLGVDGADGWEYMAAFGEHFGVDMSGFQAGLHFGPEAGCNPLIWIWWLATRSWPRLIPITIADLQAAAQQGQWETPKRPAA